jgi:hypothetical protein
MSVELMPRVRHTIAVDYSFDGSRGVVGIGVVVHESRVRGRHGPVIARFAEAYLDVPSGVGEKFTVFRALEIAAESGYRCVTVRSHDNQMAGSTHRAENRLQCGAVGLGTAAWRRHGW